MEQDLVIVGGGPAGLMAGYLFARAGVRTLVMEKHGDFLRDFRGDSIHPSTMEVFDELGLLKGLLERRHDKVRQLSAMVNRTTYRIADFTGLPSRAPFIAMMPQWEFLDFLAGEARKLPAFELRMDCEATGLIIDNARITGVETNQGSFGAKLVIAADGRNSILRGAARLARTDLGAPIDVFWFRIPKAASDDNRTQAHIGAGEMLITIDRGDYFQCARVMLKGAGDRLRQLGLQRFRMDVAKAAPQLAGWLDPIDDWGKIKLLNVTLDRLRRWWRPGLLVIGDAAHAMSPVGGVGINLAIQDAVAAANILARPLAEGENVTALLRAVQARRMYPVRAMQFIQRQVHRRVIGRILAGDKPRASLAMKLISKVPMLQRIAARVIGFGFRREHVWSPDAAAG